MLKLRILSIEVQILLNMKYILNLLPGKSKIEIEIS